MENNRLTRLRQYRSTSSYGQLNNEEEEEQENLLGRDTLVLGNLHPKKRGDWSPVRSPKDQTIECEIQPSDNLASLSLKYRVPIAEIKRVNNILTEQGFYALKRIKIPVKPYSLLLPDHMHDESEEGKNSDWLGLGPNFKAIWLTDLSKKTF